MGWQCCCSTNCGTLDFTVTLCGHPLAGVVIAVTGPSSFSGTCTTNGSGQCSISIGASGSYPWTATPPAGSGANGASGTKVVSSCVAGSHNAVVVTLTAASGYSCDPDCCVGQTGPPYVPVTWPSTVFVNDGIGTVTCSLTLLAGNRPLWTGVATRTASFAFDCNFNDGALITCGRSLAGQSVALHFAVSCSGTAGDLQASVGYYPCSNFSTAPGCAFAPGSCGHTNSIAVTEDTSCGCSGAGSVTCCVQGVVGSPAAFGLFGTDAGGMPCPPTAIGASVPISLALGGASPCDSVVTSLSWVYGGPPVSLTLTVTS